MEYDAKVKDHSEQLLAWQRSHDYKQSVKRDEIFEELRAERLSKGIDIGNTPEDIYNAQQTIKELEEKGTPFVDSDFPVDEAVGGIANVHLIHKFGKNLNEDYALFEGGTDPEDILPGILKNGWYLSSLSILAASGGVDDDNVDPLIDNLFISKSKSKVGAYAVRLYKNSQWEAIILDDTMPLLEDNTCALTHSKGDSELWAFVLEKAYAKYYKSYSLLENGYCHHALEAFTGCYSEELFILQETLGAKKVSFWEKMLTFKKNGFLMGCGSIKAQVAGNRLLESGLVFGAVYVIFEVREVDGHRLLRLKTRQV